MFEQPRGILLKLGAISGLLLLGLLPAAALARPHRVAQVPNGSVNSCLTCHKFAAGGVRNVFGHTIESNFLTPSGDVIWNSSLAAIDSDGDQRSNGTELLDPNGAWTTGTASPGNPALVTNPGLPSFQVPALELVASIALGLGLAFSGVRASRRSRCSVQIASKASE
jgi:hypothetical protein